MQLTKKQISIKERLIEAYITKSEIQRFKEAKKNKIYILSL